MITQDQLNREVIIPNPPQSIISLVPSQTELLYDLGLKDRLVGQTIFVFILRNILNHPLKLEVQKIESRKIAMLNPDVIIANKEENEKIK